MARRWRQTARRRLVAALAVILLAVLPHATLAASSFHSSLMARVELAGSHHQTDASPMTPATTSDAAAVPCHASQPSGHSSSHAAPACCILGCGLLATVATVSFLPAALPPHIITPKPDSPASDRTAEPAERPPRASPR